MKPAHNNHIIIRCLRFLLLPVSLVYASIVFIRNKLYDIGILSSQRHSDVTTIVVGNLAIGGSGKSPMTEYLIRLFYDSRKIATLSRGYGRKTKGFRFVQCDSSALEVGDEPLQFKNKFPDITVTVCEDRNLGINKLKSSHELILLDDAFQHRRLTPTLAILLFEFETLLRMQLPLPSGNLRDLMSQCKRADLIVITKSPETINKSDRNKIEQKLRKRSNAPIYYSKIEYGQPKNNSKLSSDKENLKTMHLVLVTGIANPTPLFDYLSASAQSILHLEYKDHHNFEEKDYTKIIKAYNALPEPKMIITTEKDYQRIDKSSFDGLPLSYLPITISIEDEADFKNKVAQKTL